MAATMDLKALGALANSFQQTQPMPVLFIGHGNPMNAITRNEFSLGWQQMGKALPQPRAILCISAHWETRGTAVTAMPQPRTIHDFGGFPKELSEYQYPAPGSPEVALEAKAAITKATVELDHEWGLDHGCWSVVCQMFPEATIPVLQLSLDYTKPPQWHYELARELATLRRKGVLIIGSGNMVHNLRIIDWRNQNGFDWAVEANELMKRHILSGNHKPLMDYQSLGKAVQMAIPTPEHYLPLLYTLGLKDEREEVSLFNDKTEMGSISMTSVKIG